MLFHSDLIKGNCRVTKRRAYFLSEPLWNKCCRFQVGLVWNVREICGRWGVSGTHWPLPPCHMCKRFIKPRSEVRRLGFCFLFHTDRGFNWVQISAPQSKAWQWHPFKPGPIAAQRQSKSNSFTLIMMRCVCQYTSSRRVILWQHFRELQWTLVSFASLFIAPVTQPDHLINAEYDL